MTTGASTVICHKFNVQVHNYIVYLSTLDLDYRLVFTVNMFVFISATCSNPLYAFQIKDPSVSAVNGSLRSELNKTPVCCSGFLITKPNTTICVEMGNGKWKHNGQKVKVSINSDTNCMGTHTSVCPAGICMYGLVIISLVVDVV